MDNSSIAMILFMAIIFSFLGGLWTDQYIEHLDEEKILAHLDCKTLIDKSLKDIQTVQKVISDRCDVIQIAREKP